MTTVQKRDLIFDYLTTTRTDFRGNDIPPDTKTVYKTKGNINALNTERTVIIKNIETLVEWERVVPFGLMHGHKEILQTNPHNVPAPCEKKEMEKSRKTKGQGFVPGAFSIDDVADTGTRQLLLDSMYSTDMMRSFGSNVQTGVRAPLLGKYAPTSPLTLPRVPLYVDHEWRWKSLEWDRKQIRSSHDTTKRFWLRRRS